MKIWIEIFGNIFISATFAEMGEYDTSLEIFDMNIKDSKALWDDGSASVTFAGSA